MLLTSFAVTILLENAAILIFNPTAKPFPAPAILKNALQFGPLRVASLDIVAIVVAFTLLVLLTLFVTRTEVGISMRAASEDLLAARLVGINVNAVIAAAFAIGSMLAGVVGMSVEHSRRQDRPVYGVLSRSQSVRGLGYRWVGQPTRGGAGGLCFGHPGNPAARVAAGSADALPGRIRVCRPDYFIVVPAQRNPGFYRKGENLRCNANDFSICSPSHFC